MEMDLASLGAGIVTGGALMYIYKCQCDDYRVDGSVRAGTQAYQSSEERSAGKECMSRGSPDL